MPKPFDIMSEFGKFAAEHRVSLRDPTTSPAFLRHVDEALARGMADDILLQGQRAEAMFEGLLISLGGYRLFKREDTGEVHSSDYCLAPDFRIVLPDGENWLVEVKNVYEPEPFQQERQLMTPAYRSALETYASATGSSLKLAVFWARWSVWTLVSPERLLDSDGNLVLEMKRALKVSELGRLGDRTVGTRAPLTVRLVVDPNRSQQIDADGTAEVVFGATEIRCGDHLVVDETERQIACLFIEHGDWPESGPNYLIDGDRLVAVEFRWEPEERSEHGFDIIGGLSRMFARYYAQQTLLDGAVVQVSAPRKPGWFAPVISPSSTSQTLPLWVLEIQPNYSS